MAFNTKTQGELLAARMTARQAVPRNLKLNTPRNLSVVRYASQPSNDAGLRFRSRSDATSGVMTLRTLVRERQAGAQVVEGLTAREGEEYTFDWGDGVIEVLPNSAASHVYDEDGEYTISVTNPEGEVVSSTITVPGIDTFTVRAVPSSEDSMIAVISLLVGVAPFTVDKGDGTEPTEVTSTSFDYTYDEEGDYTITATDSAGGTGETTFTAIDSTPEPVVFEITDPEDGTVTDDPLYAISGTGAEPNTEVTLWSSNRDPEVDEPNATTTSDDNGDFVFDGDHAAVEGPTTWTVFNEGVESLPITVTVDTTPEAADEQETEEATSEPSTSEDDDTPWSSMTTHAALDAYMIANNLSLPVGWENMRVVDKKTWLDENG